MPVYIPYQVCFLCGNPLEMLITVAIMLILDSLFLGLSFFVIHSVGLVLPFCLVLGHHWLLYLLDTGDEMSPALCNVDDIPFTVDNLGEILDDSAFALLCRALSTWLELTLLGGDRPAAHVLSLTKCTFLLYVSMVDVVVKWLTYWVEKQLYCLLSTSNSSALRLSLLWLR
jgi:hypothetical protein